RGVGPLPVSVRHLTVVKDFHTSLLEFVVCPLSKKQLRYEVNTNELINEELIKKEPETPVKPAQKHKTIK
uniref:Protein preY, mitochondrial n=1 Tax=Oncorhynchus tshawytscha TaxID=74940 RepID=A0A8C8IDV8_ONCTS